jgi:hypothetical protein
MALNGQTEFSRTESDGAYLEMERCELEGVITSVTGVVPAGRT